MIYIEFFWKLYLWSKFENWITCYFHWKIIKIASNSPRNLVTIYITVVNRNNFVPFMHKMTFYIDFIWKSNNLLFCTSRHKSNLKILKIKNPNVKWQFFWIHKTHFWGRSVGFYNLPMIFLLTKIKKESKDFKVKLENLKKEIEKEKNNWKKEIENLKEQKKNFNGIWTNNLGQLLKKLRNFGLEKNDFLALSPYKPTIPIQYQLICNRNRIFSSIKNIDK